MIPSSSQWAMHSTTDILVYPMSSYVIDQTSRKSRLAERQHRRSRLDKQMASNDKKSDRDARVRQKTGNRGYRAENGRGRLKAPTHRCLTDLSPKEAASRSLSRSRRSDNQVRRRSVSNSSSDSYRQRSDRRCPRRRRRRRRHRRRPAASPDQHSSTDVDRDGDRRANVTHEPDTSAVDRFRCSANVVLLTHANRSLHVLTIQRARTSVVHNGTAAVTTKVRRQHRGTSNVPAMYNYKLPGGQLMILNGDGQDDYEQKERNTCPCPDDQRWYTAALEHLKTIIQISVPLSPPDDDTDIIHGQERAPPPFMPLGKWYRTRDKEARREERASNTSSPVATYYPYKPVHVSGQAAEQKRIYAVPDALRLFRGQQLRLLVPRTKVRTVTSWGSTTVTTTTYKCKFVPLARLHENGHLYGPILSSLPTILSSLNLIYLL